MANDVVSLSTRHRVLKPAKTIHPFPARMAPEIALEAVASLPRGSTILDPMAGSGTVLRVATDTGHTAIGYDLDPLAVLMAKVWNTAIDAATVRKLGYQILDDFARWDKRLRVDLPWIDGDDATKEFIDSWFFAEQRKNLRYLSFKLFRKRTPSADALRIALSRLIVRKDGGASKGDDVSHSRPHRRKGNNNAFDVISEFERSFLRVASLLEEQPPKGGAQICNGDGRILAGLKDQSIDQIVSSPPYLNAIDYMRGHKLSLVWLGYQIKSLSLIRSTSIGAERGIETADSDLVAKVVARLGNLEELPRPQQRMIHRYVMDLREMLQSAHRVLKPEAEAVFVVGNSCLRGVYVENSTALEVVANSVGFEMIKRDERALPAMHRYLPPPKAEARGQHIEHRMRSEVVMSFRRLQTPTMWRGPVFDRTRGIAYKA